MYWHWHSLHNARETYWKGLLSHDFQENDIYLEACAIGKELQEIGSHLVNLKKKNEVAVLVSNETLTALKWFGIDATESDKGKVAYNDVVRWIYDTLYGMNVECDFIWPESEDFGQYKMIVVPALYAAPDRLLEKLNRYVENGGCLVATFKTGFANENVKVSHEVQPRILRNCLGVKYHQFAFPKKVMLRGDIVEGTDNREAKVFMELLKLDGAEALAYYEHYNWNGYAAVTRNHFAEGYAYYIGCMMDQELLKRILIKALEDAGIKNIVKEEFPVIVRKGINDFGKSVWFYLNYSEKEQMALYEGSDGRDVLTGESVKHQDNISIPAWGVRMIEG